MKSIVIKNKRIDIPVMQGGMGVGVSLSGLASSVINEGGIGTISAAQIGFLDEEFGQDVKSSYLKNTQQLKNEILKVRQLTNNGFLAVNILTASRQYNSLAQVCVENEVDAIVSGAGMAFDLPKFTKGTKTAAIPIVASSRVLNIILKKWKKNYDYTPDAIVIEGPLAGGHLGVKKSDIGKPVADLMERLEDVKEYMKDMNLNFPVFVAGGVYTSIDVKNYIDAGADGVSLGTRFICTHECDASDKFKQAIIECKQEDIIHVDSPVGYPARAITNDFTRLLDIGHIPVEKCIGCLTPCHGKNEKTPYCISTALIDSVKGDTVNGLVFTGANGYRVDKIISVHELINEITREIR